MSTITEKLKWLVEADATSAVKGFTAAGDAAEKSLKKAETSSQKLGGQLTKVGAGAVAASGIIGAALIKAAGSFEDLALKSGQMADATGLSVDQASRWIEVSGDMGIGADTIETALGKMNKTLGATPQKFADLGIAIATTKSGAEDVQGTFLNTIARLNEIEDPAKRAAAAAQIFGKGWQGSAELLKLSTDDIKTQLQSVSEQKVINEDELAKAKDYRKDLDTLKDSFESITLAVGQGAMPVIGGFASLIGNVVQGVADLDQVTGGAAGSLLAGGAAALGMVGGLTLIGGQIIKLKTQFSGFGTSVKAGMGVAAIAMLAYTINAQQDAQATADLQKSIEDLSRVSDADLMKTFVDTIVKGYFAEKDLKQTTDELAQSNLEGAKRVREMIEARLANGTASQNEKDAIGPLIQSIKDEEAARAQKITTDKLGKTTTDEATAATDAATAAADANTLATNANKVVIEALGVAADTAKRHAKSMTDDIARGLDEDKSKMDALLGSVSDDEAWLHLQQNFADTAALFDENGNVIVAKGDDAATAIRNAALAVDGLKKDVIDYGTAVLGLPTQRITDIVATVNPQSLADVEALLAALTRNRNVSLSIIAKGGAGYDVTPYGGAGAGGGDVSAGTAYMVGEKGPEMIVPRADGTLIPNGGSTGSGVQIGEVHIHVQQMPTPNQLAEIAATYTRRNGKAWLS